MTFALAGNVRSMFGVVYEGASRVPFVEEDIECSAVLLLKLEELFCCLGREGDAQFRLFTHLGMTRYRRRR